MQMFFVYYSNFHRAESPDILPSDSWNYSREKLLIFLPSEAATYLLGSNSEIKDSTRKLEVFGIDPLKLHISRKKDTQSFHFFKCVCCSLPE